MTDAEIEELAEEIETRVWRQTGDPLVAALAHDAAEEVLRERYWKVGT